MSTQSNLVLNNGETTPVPKTFSARGATMELAKYLDISSGIAIGYPMVTISSANTGRGNDGAWRTEARILLPVLEVISGADGGYTPQPKVAYNLFCKMELVAPNRSTLQNRKDLFAFAKNLLQLAVMSDSFTIQDIPT